MSSDVEKQVRSQKPGAGLVAAEPAGGRGAPARRAQCLQARTARDDVGVCAVGQLSPRYLPLGLI